VKAKTKFTVTGNPTGAADFASALDSRMYITRQQVVVSPIMLFIAISTASHSRCEFTAALKM